MQTTLAPQYEGTHEGTEAQDILRKCVHCGFCTATCPTYQLLGDELDGPRGRIYLIKQVLEGHTPTRTTQQHLDRCLTCRNCETTCPSGVQYGNLIDIGRRLVDAQVPRPAGERAVRAALSNGLTSPAFKPAMALGRWVRPLLPTTLKDKVPAPQPAHVRARAHAWPSRTHDRKVIMLAGCVQPTMLPNVNAATARVLDAGGIQTLIAASAGCCGALRQHLGEHEAALADMRRNIDAWWPLVDQRGVEAIISNASACGLQVKEYAHALANDSAYADRARRIASLARDVSEVLPSITTKLQTKLALAREAKAVRARSAPPAGGGPAATSAAVKVAFHPPCTLQHGQKLRGGTEDLLRAFGYDVQLAANEGHLCCGSAGTYSVLQPTLSKALRDRKLSNLEPLEPAIIASANVGCIQHLQSGTLTRVAHWIELVDEALSPA
jgi:glycolate oxidase iron-sulfur subunit